MTIEFRCTQCTKLLRTPDDTAGKQAKCPECGAIMQIPTLSSSAPPSAAPGQPEVPGGAFVPPPPPPGTPQASSPFGPGAGPQSAAGSPFGAADPNNPYAAPSTYAAEAPGPQGELGHGTLDFGDVFARTWNILKANYGMCLVVILAVWGINVAAGLLVGIGTGVVGAVTDSLALANAVSFVGQIVSWVFGTWLSIGMALFYLKMAKGQPVSLGEIFSGGPFLLNVIVASVLLGLMFLAIALGCVGIPALIGLAISKEAAAGLAMIGAVISFIGFVPLMLMFSQFYYLILDRNCDPIQSLKLSVQIMEGNKLILLLVWIVAVVVGSLFSLLTCFIGGLLLVAPFLMLMYAVIYLIITQQPTVDQLQRPQAYHGV